MLPLPLGLVAIEQFNHNFKLYFSEEFDINTLNLAWNAYNNFIISQFNLYYKWIVITVDERCDYKALNQVIKDLKCEHLERKLMALLEAERK